MKDSHAKLLSWAFLYLISLIGLSAYAYEIFSLSRSIRDGIIKISFSEQNYLLLLSAALPISHLCAKIPFGKHPDHQKVVVRAGISICVLVIFLASGFAVQRYYKSQIYASQYYECVNERHTGLRSSIKIFKKSPRLCK